MKTTVRFLSLTILMSVTLFLQQSNAQTVGIVSPFAGSGTYGSANGTGAAAQFDNPTGVVMDASGNVFVADGANNKIRKITPAGVVTTFAGSGTAGGANGTGTAATFNWPFAIAIGAGGTLYVADYDGHRIRKITSAGVVTTLAGNGTSGSTNGTGTGATFSYPTGIAVDASGNVYVVDYGNRKIRKITPAGVVTTFAGSGASGSADGTGTAATFNSPIGVAVDASGNVFVTDNGINKIRKITPAGVVSTFAGSGAAGSADGTGTAATFNTPYGITIDGSGNIFLTDLFNYKIRKITPAGVVTTLAGSGASGSADGIGSAASFTSAYSITTNSAGNLLYVADKVIHKIRKVNIKQTQNITGLSNLNKMYNDPAFTLSGVASSGLTVSYTSSNPNVGIIIGNTVTINGPGTATITASQAGNGVYAPVDVNITLTVKVAQNITGLIDLNKVNTDPAFTLSGLASSGLTVSYSSSNTAVATVSGNTVTITGGGSTTITASQAGDGLYAPATNVNITLTVKLAQNMTGLSDLNKVDTDPAFTLSGVASSGLLISYSSSNTAVATVSGNTIAITGIGTTTITATQAGDGTYAPAAEVSITLTVTVDTGIDNGYSVSLNVYPNPATEILNIPLSGEKHIRVYDLLGKLITEEVTSTDQLVINELPEDMYILEIEQAGKKYCSRLMKK